MCIHGGTVKKQPTWLIHYFGESFYCEKENIQRYPEESRTKRKESRLDIARAREAGEEEWTSHDNKG